MSHSDLLYVGLVRIILIRFVYGIFGREITKPTAMYGVYIRLWPTLFVWLHRERHLGVSIHLVTQV